MRRKFARRPPPVLAGVIKERTVKEAAAAIRQAQLHGAGCIDLHLSSLPGEEVTENNLRQVLAAARIPVMALQYDRDYWGRPLGLSDHERIAQLMTAAQAGVDCVDLPGHILSPGDTLDSIRNRRLTAQTAFAARLPREVTLDQDVIAMQAELISRFHALGTEVLLSVHTGVSMDCGELLAMVGFLVQRGPDVIKVVGRCDTDEELEEFCKTVPELRRAFPECDVSYHCAGAKGPLTRVIGPMLGSYLIFCNETYTAASDLNQLHLGSMAAIWDLLKKQGIIGG